jgi:serine protease
MARQLPAAVSMAGSLGLHRKGGAAGREMLFRISDQQTTLQALGIQQSASATDDIWQQKQDTLAIINALRQRPDVAYALPNYIVRPTLVPNDTYFPKQWHYNLINLPQAWDVTIGDRTPNVIVAVVDTGVLPDHPDLQDKLVPGYDFVVNRNGQNIELDNEPGIDPHPTDPGGSVAGSNFHGTHVTGTVAAATNNNAGVAGVGWNVKVMPLRALGADEGSLYDVGQAVRYAAGLDNDSGTKPDQPADIINLSLGAVLDPAVVDQLREPFDLARQAGVIVIAAAGNDSVSADFFPASLDSVISVNAVDMNKQLASYSNFGPTIDLSAPGGDSGDIDGDGVFDGVYSLGADDSGTSLVYGYTLAAGTSMASPHVSGVAALMKSVLPDMTPDDFDHFLKTGTITEDLGDPGRDDTFGYGLIDARKAVVAAASGQVPQLDPVAIVSPTSLNLTPDRTAVDINIRNGGDGTLSLPAPEPISNDSGGWLQVTPVDVDNNGLGRYRVAINSANVPPDATTLAAVITITTDVNTLQVPVIAQLQVIPFANNAGTQYVLLLDDSYQRQYGIEAQVSDGTYRFRFNNVAKGIYYLITGSDINNNNQICDPGESCGQYPTLDHPRIIEITADSIYFVTDESAPGGTVNATPSAAGLEFETGYHVTISSQNAAIQRSPVNR